MSGRVRVQDLARMLLTWAVSSLALIIAAELLPGFSASSPWSLVAAAAVTGVFGAVIRPVLVAVSAVIGWFAVVLVAIAGQAIAMLLALLVVPGVEVSSFWSAVAATWVAAIVGTALTWLFTAGTDEVFGAAVVKYGGKAARVPDPEVDGVLFVQIDGLSFPVAQWALQSGTMPTLRRWLDTGSHRLDEWTVQLPCTTPASQQGILHGTCAGIPAFRWYDRELERVLVANRPEDAAIIEKRASTGAGLLADGGVSVSNLFSGDAVRAHVTMSRVNLSRGSAETRRTFARFVVRPDGFARSLARTSAEVVRERFQARQQRRRRVLPRVSRPWSFALLRAVSNGIMRDLNTAIVAHEMMQGARSIYVDYVDYDEVAHHAGGTRIEALRVLESLDAVLAALESVAAKAPRHYHLVVLSDHGQSQGLPFADRFGTSLADICGELTQDHVDSVETDVESWGRAESLADDLAGQSGVGGQTAANVATRMRRRTSPDDGSERDEKSSDLVVLGSGNLGLVYTRGTRRLFLEELEERWPRLVTGLAVHPGIGFVAVMSRDEGPVALGADGSHRLRDGAVRGKDPLEPFPVHASTMLRVALERDEAPEIYVNSTLDSSTGEVAAFEGLVGCHGGLGGWQDRGTLIAPAALVPDGTHPVGAEALHRLLVSVLVQLGHRTRTASHDGTA